jgi:hypothetical protein
MKRLFHAPVILLTALYASALTYFLAVYIQSARWTVLNHEFRFEPVPIIGLFILIWALFLGGRELVSRLNPQDTEKTGGGEESPRNPWAAIVPTLPLLFLTLTPLVIHPYFSRADLRERLRTGAFVIVLTMVFFWLLGGRRVRTRRWARAVPDKFSSLSRRKRLLWLFAAAFLVYTLCTFILINRGVTFSGDEPYYLMTTHSLYQDGDINVANNYEEQDHFEFYSREDNPRLKLPMYARAGRKGRSHIYPINLSGISFLILPHYWLSRLFEGPMRTFILKGSLALWAVLLGLQLYLFVLDRWKREETALKLWALYAFTAPILFYATHLYPEVPIALFCLYIFRKLTGEVPPSTRQMLFMGSVLGLFIWFGLKYNMIFGPFLLVGIYLLLKEHKAGWKIVSFIAPPLLSFGLFYIYVFTLYGSFSPFSVYEGVMTPDKVQAFKEMMVSIPVMLRVDTFLDYFLDQRDGLLLYSPLYFFAFLGMVEAFRRRKREFWILLFLIVPYIFNYAFFSHRQGHSPQGRILAPITWAAVIFIAYFVVHNRKKGFAFLFRICAALSLAAAALLLCHPSFLYQPTTHEFTARPGEMFVYLSNLHVFLPRFLPSFIKIDNLGYIPNYVWIAALLALVILYILRSSDKPMNRPVRSGTVLVLCGAALWLWVLHPRTALYPTQVFRYSNQAALGFYNLEIGKGVVAKGEAELYLHIPKTYRILFSSKRPLERIKVKYGSEQGKYDLRFSLFDLPPEEDTTAYELKEIDLDLPVYFPFRNLYLYEINLILIHHSDENMLRLPYLFQIFPRR